jgi:hypothetical protein
VTEPAEPGSRLCFLWGPPRSLSTAFLRMMVERGGHEVLHEPFSSIVVRGRTTVGGQVVTRVEDLVAVLAERSAHRRIFVKETTEYDYLADGGRRALEIGRHTFIIRHPRSVIPSHYAMNPRVTCAEVGYRHQAELARLAWARDRPAPVVVEAERLVADPTGTVADYCAGTGMPFLPAALTWAPRDHQVWSRSREWHRDAARSTGFVQPRHHYRHTVDNTPLLAEYYRYHLPHYEFLRRRGAGVLHLDRAVER